MQVLIISVTTTSVFKIHIIFEKTIWIELWIVYSVIWIVLLCFYSMAELYNSVLNYIFLELHILALIHTYSVYTGIDIYMNNILELIHWSYLMYYFCSQNYSNT